MPRKLAATWLIAATVALGASVNARVLIERPAIKADPQVETRPTVVDPALVEVVKELGAADFAAREAAQRKIDSLDQYRRAELLAVLATQTDTEAVARLKKHLEKLDDSLAIAPLPISLKLDKANIQEAVQALSNELGSPVRATYTGSPGPISMAIDKQSIFDVFKIFQEKGITLQPMTRDGEYAQYPSFYNYQVQNGFAAYFAGITTTKSADATGIVGQQTVVSVGILADPRIRILVACLPTIHFAADNAGNVLLDRKPQENTASVEPPKSVFLGYNGIPIPPRAGNRIAVLKGQATFVVKLAEQIVVIDDLAKRGGQTFFTSSGSFRIDRVLVKDGRATVDVTRSLIPEAPSSIFDAEITDPELTRLGGRVLWKKQGIHRLNAEFDFEGKGVLQLKLSVPNRTQKIVVPFELKDIPLPL